MPNDRTPTETRRRPGYNRAETKRDTAARIADEVTT